MHIIGGIIGVIIGFLLIRYSVALTEMFGTVAWAEEHLRPGLAGTYSLYRLVGLAFIVLSLLYMFGGIGLIVSPLGSIFGGVKPTP
jgi:hypothetical protein